MDTTYSPKFERETERYDGNFAVYSYYGAGDLIIAKRSATQDFEDRYHVKPEKSLFAASFKLLLGPIPSTVGS